MINADDSDPLTIKNGVLANAGTVKATSTGGLIFQDETVDNAGGTVEAITSGSVIDFVASSLSNGTLSTVAGSSIVIRSFGDTTIDPVTLTNAGNIILQDNAELTLGATNPINNTGTIALHAALMKSDGFSAASLINDGNTISGDGVIGDGNLTLVNDSSGVIDANNSTLALVINTGNNAVINAGRIEATAGGLLIIECPIVNSGKIIADNATVALGDTPTGSGSLVIEGSGNMELVAAGTTQGVTFASGATGKLTLDAAATPTPTSVYDGTISGFGTGDAIDLAGLAYVAGSTLISTGPTFTPGPGGGSTTFTVVNGTDAVQLTFAGNLTSHTFVLGEDTRGDVLITDPISKPAVGGVLANVALLGSYIASAFPSALGGFTATTTETAQSQAVLALPHAG